MQNKGLIKLFAILFGIVCLYQLSFTWFAKNAEKDAVNYAESKSIDNEPTESVKFQKEIFRFCRK